MFYGDYRYGKDPLAFLTYLETTLANLPHLSEPKKCEHFYLRCKSDSDAEDWPQREPDNSHQLQAHVQKQGRDLPYGAQNRRPR